MEKYAVVLDDEKVKTANAGRLCPSCGSNIDTPKYCPNCGTKPFEKQSQGGTLGRQEGEEGSSGGTPTE